MKHKRATLADIAKEVSVTTATVSYVLNGKHAQRISPATRQKVLSVAKKLKYSPDAHARSLVTGKSSSIALYYPDHIENALSSPYASLLLRGVMQKCVLSDYSLQVLIENDRLKHASVDGWVCVMNQRPMSEEVLRGKPVVYIDPAWGMDAWAIQSEQSLAGQLLAKHLREQHHSTLVFAMASHPPCTQSHYHERYQWFKAGMEEKSAIVRVSAPTLAETAEQALQCAISKNATAIVTASEDLALVVLQHLHSSGMKVPSDIKLATFNDSDGVRLAHPQLTYVDMAMQELGYRAASLLFNRIDKKVENAQSHLLTAPKPRLVLGQTA